MWILDADLNTKRKVTDYLGRHAILLQLTTSDGGLQCYFLQDRTFNTVPHYIIHVYGIRIESELHIGPYWTTLEPINRPGWSDTKLKF